MSTKTSVFGDSRTHIGPRHALIAPDGHVPSSLPGIDKATAVVLISEELGASFTQVLFTLQANGGAVLPSSGAEAFAYIVRGSVNVEIGGHNHSLSEGGFVFAPAGLAWKLERASEGAQLNLFFKRYVPLDGAVPPAIVVGREGQVTGQPYLGDEDARLQILLPDSPSFDMAVNILNYNPGAYLPFVETHVMEHGLLMLEGKGIYRLEDAWYPVAAGDCIWMAPYCPQWFTAMGKSPARYLYYKDVNRPVFPHC
jgi:(S)-ureidoglycine aminohydrolase